MLDVVLGGYNGVDHKAQTVKLNYPLVALPTHVYTYQKVSTQACWLTRIAYATQSCLSSSSLCRVKHKHSPAD